MSTDEYARARIEQQESRLKRAEKDTRDLSKKIDKLMFLIIIVMMEVPVTVII